MARFILTRANGPNAGSVNVIGLSEEEMQILEEASGQADPMRNNSDGMTISNIPTHCVLNMLGQMGYRVVASTGAQTIVWTLFKCDRPASSRDESRGGRDDNVDADDDATRAGRETMTVLSKPRLI
ncbi:unnamed protein product [Cyprideis torosa]|uniref:GTP cyclohydrolase I feedback regulatory protein n=1 Tax=Cyprideis torosa TaxID=163714 RepID=A0A7R8WJX4_9CRUS|nr:unnamed protein product [Cyprideis torosa]CAG0902532.1 unnamed protein product [Cyprideis torosa]